MTAPSAATPPSMSLRAGPAFIGSTSMQAELGRLLLVDLADLAEPPLHRLHDRSFRGDAAEHESPGGAGVHRLDEYAGRARPPPACRPRRPRRAAAPSPA